MKSCIDNEDLLLEAMGIMSSLTLSEIDYDKILTELQLLPLLLTKMKVRYISVFVCVVCWGKNLCHQDPATRDDLILETIMLCATLATDVNCAVKFVEAGVSEALIGILRGEGRGRRDLRLTSALFLAKQEDDEVVLQIVFLFHQLVVHESSRHSVTKESSIFCIVCVYICLFVCVFMFMYGLGWCVFVFMLCVLVVCIVQLYNIVLFHSGQILP